MKIYFSNDLAGLIVSTTSSTALFYDYRPEINRWGGAGAYLNQNQKMAVTLSGYFTDDGLLDGSMMYQTVAGEWINSDDGWKSTTRESIRSAAEAQKMINKMIENNKKIIACNLFCAHYANKLTADEKKRLYDLQTRLENRNQQLIDNGLVTSLQISTPAGYSQFEGDLMRFMRSGGVGVVITGTAAIVISCVVVVSMATAAYFAYKYLFEESAEDVKYSKELTEALMAKLTPEEYDQLMRETQGIVTRTKIKQLVSSSSGVVKWIFAGVGIYAIYQFLFNKKGE